jgi:NitT/TauT family transport system ATP-binding protein
MGRLSLVGVSHTYHSKRAETLALKDIDLEVADGEFFGIVGPSGSGKTTLLSIMAGVLAPSHGEVLLDGVKNTSGKVGYMLQRDQLFEWRTIWRNVILGLELGHSRTEQSLAYARELLVKYGLWDFRNRYPHELSGGMRQRAALIRTMVLRPSVILLDEPFSALDFQTRLSVGEDVHAIIKNEGLTAVLVTHDISEAISLCDRVAVLSRRPATVKAVFDIPLASSCTLERREDPQYALLFKRIWKELDVHEEENLFVRTSSVSQPPQS